MANGLEVVVVPPITIDEINVTIELPGTDTDDGD